MYKTFIKRIIDIAFALTGIIVLFVPAIIIALLIKLDSKGPVFFKHERYGKDKKVFTIYKFRSMHIDTPKYCATNDLKDYKSHITKLGRFLRLSSIDELPQLVNVLKGEMSIVGPRPVITSEIKLINEREKYGANSCKPGITGWAQVNGRDELRIKEKARMDGEYARKLGFITDLKCVALTFGVILSAKGHKEASSVLLLPDEIPQQIINELRSGIETAN